MGECPNFNKLRGCRFEPRYDETPSGLQFEGAGPTPSELRDLLIKRTYVRDVCVRCGKTIERKGL